MQEKRCTKERLVIVIKLPVEQVKMALSVYSGNLANKWNEILAQSEVTSFFSDLERKLTATKPQWRTKQMIVDMYDIVYDIIPCMDKLPLSRVSISFYTIFVSTIYAAVQSNWLRTILHLSHANRFIHGIIISFFIPLHFIKIKQSRTVSRDREGISLSMFYYFAIKLTERSTNTQHEVLVERKLWSKYVWKK